MVYTGGSTSDQFKSPNSDPNFLISYFVQSLHCPYLVIYTLFNCLPGWLRLYYRRWMTLCKTMETLVGVCPFVELNSTKRWEIECSWRNFRLCTSPSLCKDPWGYSMTMFVRHPIFKFAQTQSWGATISYFNNLSILLSSLGRIFALDKTFEMKMDISNAIVITSPKFGTFLHSIRLDENRVYYLSDDESRISRSEEEFMDFIKLAT